MPDGTWLSKYESVKDKLRCRIDLDEYFHEEEIGRMSVATMDIGMVHCPTGTMVACDPLVELGRRAPYLQHIPVGIYPVTICVVPSDTYGDRYACVKVAVSDHHPVRYELGMTGDEDLDGGVQPGDSFGFGVDAGLGCIIDVQTQKEYRRYWGKRCAADDSLDSYHDLFCNVLEESYRADPLYQRYGGDWANWTVPGTDCNIPLFASGWGDGGYPCYFGYDRDGAVTGVYVLFIDVAREYSE